VRGFLGRACRSGFIPDMTRSLSGVKPDLHRLMHRPVALKSTG
jgi:hypothetical protein